MALQPEDDDVPYEPMLFQNRQMRTDDGVAAGPFGRPYWSLSLWRRTIPTTDRNPRTEADHRGSDSCTNCRHRGTDCFRRDHLFPDSNSDSRGPSRRDSCLYSHTHSDCAAQADCDIRARLNSGTVSGTYAHSHADDNRYRDHRTNCDANPYSSADFHHHPDQHS